MAPQSKPLADNKNKTVLLEGDPNQGTITLAANCNESHIVDKGYHAHIAHNAIDVEHLGVRGLITWGPA